MIKRAQKAWNAVEPHIKIWCEFAGINKPVTFHTSRHSFAVNILDKNKIATVDLLDDSYLSSRSNSFWKVGYSKSFSVIFIDCILWLISYIL